MNGDIVSLISQPFSAPPRAGQALLPVDKSVCLMRDVKRVGAKQARLINTEKQIKFEFLDKTNCSFLMIVQLELS